MEASCIEALSSPRAFMSRHGMLPIEVECIETNNPAILQCVAMVGKAVVR